MSESTQQRTRSMRLPRLNTECGRKLSSFRTAEQKFTRSLDGLLVTGHMSLVTSTFMCGPHFCSMKITEDVRKYAAEKGVSDQDAIQLGLEQKAKDFKESDSEVYAKA